MGAPKMIKRSLEIQFSGILVVHGVKSSPTTWSVSVMVSKFEWVFSCQTLAKFPGANIDWYLGYGNTCGFPIPNKTPGFVLHNLQGLVVKSLCCSFIDIFIAVSHLFPEYKIIEVDVFFCPWNAVSDCSYKRTKSRTDLNVKAPRTRGGERFDPSGVEIRHGPRQGNLRLIVQDFFASVLGLGCSHSPRTLQKNL